MSYEDPSEDDFVLPNRLIAIERLVGRQSNLIKKSR
jgi:hypothetical protein